MISYSGPRRNGKTKALIDKYHKYGGIIVVYSSPVRSWFIKQYALPPRDIITYSEFEQGLLRGRKYHNIFIDQIDEYIRWKTASYVTEIFVTFTGQDCTKELFPLYKAMNA